MRAASDLGGQEIAESGRAMYVETWGSDGELGGQHRDQLLLTQY